MAEDNRGKDNHLGLRFWIQIEGVEIAGFSECSGLTIETEVFEYSEGGQNHGSMAGEVDRPGPED
jgi:phage tail-like protein